MASWKQSLQYVHWNCLDWRIIRFRRWCAALDIVWSGIYFLVKRKVRWNHFLLCHVPCCLSAVRTGKFRTTHYGRPCDGVAANFGWTECHRFRTSSRQWGELCYAALCNKRNWNYDATPFSHWLKKHFTEMEVIGHCQFASGARSPRLVMPTAVMSLKRFECESNLMLFAFEFTVCVHIIVFVWSREFKCQTTKLKRHEQFSVVEIDNYWCVFYGNRLFTTG